MSVSRWLNRNLVEGPRTRSRASGGAIDLRSCEWPALANGLVGCRPAALAPDRHGKARASLSVPVQDGEGGAARHNRRLAGAELVAAGRAAPAVVSLQPR